VEQRVAEHYRARRGGSGGGGGGGGDAVLKFEHCVHAENKPVRLLFWLLLHKEIFAPVAGVARVPCGFAPLDFETADFCARRGAAFARRLAAIGALDSDALARTVRAAWDALRGLSLVGLGCSSEWSRFPRCAAAASGGGELEGGDGGDGLGGDGGGVRWGGRAAAQHFGRERVCALARCLGGRRVARLLRVVLFGAVAPSGAAEPAALSARSETPRAAYWCGLPDLWLFSSSSRSVKLVEVKAPGDVLRPHQKRWLRRLAECGIECGVVVVRHAERDPR
jgi:hypothetical protein